MIKIKKILCAGGACPYQIEAITEDDKFFYLRYRGGWLRAGASNSSREFKYDDESYNIINRSIGDMWDGSRKPELFESLLRDKIEFKEEFNYTQDI